MNKKNNQIYKDNDQYIQDVFIDMLEKMDVNQITVKAICEKVGINRSTFYTHYIDIYDLLNKIEKKYNQEFKNQIISIYHQGKIEDERMYFVLFLKYLKKYKKFYKSCLQKRTHFPIENGFEELFEKIAKPIFIQKGITDTNEMMYHMVYIQAGLTNIEKKWIENDCQESPEYIADIIIRCLKRY